MNAVNASKPRTWVIAALLILRGILLGVLAAGILSLQAAQSVIGGATPLYAALLLAMGLALLIGGGLVAGRKRIGLLIGGVVTALEFPLALLMLIAYQTAPNGLSLLVAAGLLFYIYRYLTHEPEKSYFV